MNDDHVTPSSISVIVPARNEEATVGQVVERSFRVFTKLGREGEVLVVNDGSTDDTGTVLDGLTLTYPTLRVFTHRRSRGMTVAMQRMFSASRCDIVILIPADMESDPVSDIPALVNYLEENDLDVVAGWRQGRKDGKVVASAIYNVVMRRLAGVPVHDGNWVKALRREVVEKFATPTKRLAPLHIDDRIASGLSHWRSANSLSASSGGE